MGTTTPDALGYPDVGYTSGIRLAVKALADTTQTALVARAGRTFRPADAAALTALSSSYTLQTDDRAFQVDTGVNYRYNGSAWVLDVPGLVIPTSVAGTGVTVSSTTGLVTFSASSTISVNGCFTSAYSQYEITSSRTMTATAATGMRLRAAGTDNSTAASYGQQRFYSTGATNAGAAPAAASSWAQIDTSDGGATVANWFKLVVINPAAAAVTSMRSDWGNTLSTSTAFTGHGFYYHNAASAMDGFSLLIASGSTTGTLSIRGIV